MNISQLYSLYNVAEHQVRGDRGREGQQRGEHKGGREGGREGRRAKLDRWKGAWRRGRIDRMMVEEGVDGKE